MKPARAIVERDLEPSTDGVELRRVLDIGPPIPRGAQDVLERILERRRDQLAARSRSGRR